MILQFDYEWIFKSTYFIITATAAEKTKQNKNKQKNISNKG